MQKRCFDIIFALIVSIFAIAPVIVIWLILASIPGFGYLLVAAPGGRSVFMMPKFRSMRINTPVATDKLTHARTFITPFGHFAAALMNYLKFTQFCAVMSIVGPRLHNQCELVTKRAH